MEIITLVSSEGKSVDVPREIVKGVQIIDDVLEDAEEGEISVIPLPQISGVILDRFIEFRKYFSTNPYPEIPKPVRGPDFADSMPHAWYADYMSRGDEVQLFKAADFLNDQALLKLAAAKIATTVVDKPPEEFAARYGLSVDVGSVEFEAYKRANVWICPARKMDLPC